MGIRTWGWRQLVASWIAYWAVLGAIVAGPAILRWYELQRTGGHGTVSLSYDGSALAAALWVTGPPLALALLWLLTRPPRVGAQRDAAKT